LAYTLCNWRISAARVITTVSAHGIDFVKRLGADEAIDYKSSRFEKEVRDVDVVFDAVGGDTFERSWGVLKPDGRMITIAADSENKADQRVKDAFFIVEPNQKKLVEIAKQLDAGHLRAFVKTTVPLNEVPPRTVERSRAKADTERSSSPFPPNHCFDQTRLGLWAQLPIVCPQSGS
jgi:NADPH:quinone reductase-like Zn-dependent oxidoreductase